VQAMRSPQGRMRWAVVGCPLYAGAGSWGCLLLPACWGWQRAHRKPGTHMHWMPGTRTVEEASGIIRGAICCGNSHGLALAAAAPGCGVDPRHPVGWSPCG
jgi:hypothetical protein